jgi:choline transport protein
MASMAPTSGGQYHWVSELAPPKCQQYLSHLTGWMSTLSWQAATASGPFLVGTLIQASVQVNYPDYSPTNWQGTLFVFAVTLIVWAMNVYVSRAMPLIQNMMLIVRVGGFLAIMIIFWVLSPHNRCCSRFHPIYCRWWMELNGTEFDGWPNFGHLRIDLYVFISRFMWS